MVSALAVLAPASTWAYMPSSPTRVESPDEHVFDRETARAILACNDTDEVIKLLAEMK